MSNDDWIFQLSVKFGATGNLVNVRGKTIADFMEACRDLTSNAPEVLAAATSLAPHEPPNATSAPSPISAPSPAPVAVAPPQNAGETHSIVGTLEKCDVSNGVGKNGKPYTRYVAVISGTKASTFDSLYGSVLQQSVGQKVSAEIEATKFGYNLHSVRPVPQ